MSPMPALIYLHGFASSPASVKAGFFRDHFERWGIDCRVLDLNEPSFSTLTLSRSIGRVLDEVGTLPEREPLALMGSSLGGLVAAQSAARLPGRVAALVLMAPAFHAPVIWERLLGPEEMGRWRATGWLSVEHPAYPRPQPLHYAFYEDLRRQDTAPPAVDCPSLVFHGRRDDVVDPPVSREFGQRNPSARVVLLEDGHDLLASRSRMLAVVEPFLRKHLRLG